MSTDRSMRPERPGDDPVLKLIHGAMLSGTLLFFAVVFFMFNGREVTETSGLLRWAWLGAAVVAVFAAGFVRGRLGNQPDVGEVRAAGIIIWAFSEGAALLGMVSTIVTGEMMSAIGGTLIGVFLLVHHRPSELG